MLAALKAKYIKYKINTYVRPKYFNDDFIFFEQNYYTVVRLKMDKDGLMYVLAPNDPMEDHWQVYAYLIDKYARLVARYIVED